MLFRQFITNSKDMLQNEDDIWHIIKEFRNANKEARSDNSPPHILVKEQNMMRLQRSDESV